MSKLIIDIESGEEVLRELTKAEKDQEKIDSAKAETLRNELEAKAEAKEAARQAILDRIGLTSEELQTILG